MELTLHQRAFQAAIEAELEGLGRIDQIEAACEYYHEHAPQAALTVTMDEATSIRHEYHMRIINTENNNSGSEDMRESVNTVLSRRTAEPPAEPSNELIQLRELRRQLMELDRSIDPETMEETTVERVKYLCRVLVPNAAEPQPAESSPAPVDAPSGDVVAQMLEAWYETAGKATADFSETRQKECMTAAYNVACADLLEHPPAEWLERIDKAIVSSCYDYGEIGMIEPNELANKVRARLTTKPVERVTVEHTKEGGWCVRKDGLDLATFIWSEDAERYAAGLRAELAKEAEDAK